ncbi:MAG TPA: NAD(P)/FAD-dependent oxidoreductase [Nocardioidaceae bacterium]|nr:NAD(P)/FAD-dependent oxidoreductase [Nocardioidaceae bacterium]
MDNTTALRAAHVDTRRVSAPLDVLVVGAGQAGLSLAWHLARTNVRYLLVDAAPEVGHSWRTRWDSLKLFTPAQYAGLPGTDFPAVADCYPTKDQVADFLAVYAERHSLPILTSTRVNRLEPHHGGFAAHTTQGVLNARQVVVATGPFHVPFVPTIDGAFDVPAVHSSGYRRPSDLPSGRVLVVGGANSGLQIAEELIRTRQVVLSAGTNPPAVPQRPLGRDLFWWLTRLGLMDKGPDSRLAQRMRARGDLVVGSNRRALRRAGVDFRGRAVRASGRTATFADGTSIEVDAVVWATGFRPDYSWIDVPELTDDTGMPLHDCGRSVAVPGLWFLGLPWQRTRGSALLGFVQRDAAHVHSEMSTKVSPIG